MGTEKVVWLLGSGFSKPLGGPLLRDLFQQQEREEILPYFPGSDYPDLARVLPWVQKCFHLGKPDETRGANRAKGLWADAEDFLAYVDDAFGSCEHRRKLLDRLIAASKPNVPTEVHQGISPVEGKAEREFQRRMRDDFGREVRRALAAECHRFLMDRGNSAKSESFEPYKRWARSLIPGVDTVITFNYDLVIETAAELAGVARMLDFVCPNADPSGDTPTDPKTGSSGRVPVLKLHGSVDWKHSSGHVYTLRRSEILKDPKVDIAIASPGASKEELAGGHFRPLWDHAERALTDATRLIIVGYSFPLSDPAAQIRLLDAFTRGNVHMGRSAHTILGPDTDTRRMLSLLRSTAPTRGHVCVAQTIPKDPPRGGNVALYIVQHPLGAQDFIGRHDGYTATREETRV